MNDDPGRPRPAEPEPIAPLNLFGRPRLDRGEKIRRQIEKGRQSRIPTWVLVVALLLTIAGWAAVILVPATW